MKLIKSPLTSHIHAISPIPPQNKIRPSSFCGLILKYYGIIEYEGDSNTVTCKTCKKLMQKYIINKLKKV